MTEEKQLLQWIEWVNKLFPNPDILQPGQYQRFQDLEVATLNEHLPEIMRCLFVKNNNNKFNILIRIYLFN